MPFSIASAARSWVLITVMLVLVACGGGSSGGSSPAQVAVPNVVGLTSDAAGTAIARANLGLGSVTAASSATVASGSIISQTPAAGTMVAPNSLVSVVVSSGPAQVLVPNVVGMTQAAATTSISSVGLVVGTLIPATSATVPAGSVLTQSPAASLYVPPGSTVNLIISSGTAPAQVAVPNVVGLTLATATTSITSAGLVLEGYAIENSPTVAAGMVIYVSPSAGTEVSPGTDVYLTVSIGPVPPPPTPVVVPNVVGQTQSSAFAAITGAELVVGTVTRVSSATVAAGSIINQTPAGASTVESGSIVNLTVSGGAGGNFAYVANTESATISAFAINQVSGALTPLTPATIPVVPNPSRPGELNGLAVDPSGRFLYAIGTYTDMYKGVVWGLYAYAINSSDGSLTALPGSPFPTADLPESIAFDASGNYLYESNSNGISAFAIDSTSGALTLLTNSSEGSGAAQLVRVGNYVYVADENSNNIGAFSIEPALGVLGPDVPGAPFATDAEPTGLVANPSGSALYAISYGASTGDNRALSAFTINSATGALTPVAGTPIAVPATSYMTIDPQGRYLIIAGDLGVYVYPLDISTGAIGTPVAGSPFSAGVTSTYDPVSISIDPSGQFVYVCDEGRVSLGSGNAPAGAIDEFTLNSNTGALTPVTGSPVNAGTNPGFITFK